MLHTVLCLFLGMYSLGVHASTDIPDPIIGDWQTFDDSTGGKRAVVRISYNLETESYVGRIIERNSTEKVLTGLKLKDTCDQCPKPFKGKKVKGMVVLWGLKKNDKSKKFPYNSGFIIDPNTGYIYGLEANVSKNKRVLYGRGHLQKMKGISRKQQWLRVR